jgi:hypothetical protein
MHHQVELAILPELSLAETIQEWRTIHRSLAESPRQRKAQVAAAFGYPLNKKMRWIRRISLFFLRR